ncbi:PTS transporter subunit EIIB [Mediterraneibacter gnavus]|uniref:PTS transporter subunit EIIB n=1 Tax=Mediterraneibacter gnavus TaxID=33038 RepID=UPI0036F22A4D
MAQIRDYRKLAHDIICEVGGKENIVNATRCATRLRLVLKEEPEQAKEKVAAMAGVITVVENSGQFQVVIGTHVGEVYDVVAEELHLDTENLQVEQPKQSVMNKVIATMSAVFAPFVYILAAAGLLQGGVDPGQYGSSIFCRNWDVCGIEFYVMDAIYISSDFYCNYRIQAL